ncbi:putative peptidoglycan lipid II flippase [Actinophytocola algeriensis]|uniref:Putative peptidoglycan lipid II flippase n=1 Tax=Actinophytocola algeriensis TaxID=1768010 RepID=A0A7W7Q430_9PSEU|nr:murein biosynthesis integral membrane protein MurJ [Actinophytocola algeriensis]MBB4906692.1 putative peptidoglycan lipid II flippase [Actinophytocola algeriensis]MBE1478173.1 putative peptidoglycan lipid II flippase [Actinophytocola algeriensis]
MDPPSRQKPPSLAKASGSMAVATLVSRITGFVWKIQLAWVAGLGVVNDSFTVANTLPNIVYELLLGGVLASVVVPLLVRSQDDPDGGQAYTNRLLTVGMTMLLAGTVVAVALAPLLTGLYMDDSTGKANSDLATAFAYLLLPEIVFYGLFALLSAVLQAKHVFGPTAWAPVINNLVIMGTLGLYAVVPGEISLNPVRMGDAKLLVLGVGVTLGIVVQALVLVPALRRTGFRYRWTWGLDSRLKEFGGLALWILGYVAVSQVGMVITTRVLTAGANGGASIYSNAWLLFQLPYGVIGVSLLTAIMPRLSRSAADGDTEKLVGDLSLGSRLSTVLLVPISAILTIAGSAVGIALFGVGEADIADAARLGDALAFSAFGILPYALVMLQLRVFYAMKDARTPTLIMIVMTVVKIPLLYFCADRLRPEDVVIGVLLVNSLTYVVGAVLGQMWLWVRLGRLQSMRVVKVIVQTIVAGVAGILAAWGMTLVVDMVLGDGAGPRLTAWVHLVVQGLVTTVVAFGLLVAFRVPELQPATQRITRLVRRG